MAFVRVLYDKKKCMPFNTGKVGKNIVEVLRSTNNNGVIASREFVNEKNLQVAWVL